MTTHGGKRERAGRKPRPDPSQNKILKHVWLTPALDAWVRANQQAGEGYGATVERLLRAVYTVES